MPDLSNAQPRLALEPGPWHRTRDGDHSVRMIFDRHYSRRRYTDGGISALFVGPGEKMVLITPCARAVLIWRKFVDGCIDQRTGQPQAGVNCALFRNEGAGLSSDLILAAQAIAWRRWPGERLYTYIDPYKVRHKRDPGRCFRKAGWNLCGRTQGGLLIFEALPQKEADNEKN